MAQPLQQWWMRVVQPNPQGARGRMREVVGGHPCQGRSERGRAVSAALISPAAPSEMTSSGGRSPRARSSSRKSPPPELAKDELTSVKFSASLLFTQLHNRLVRAGAAR